MTESVSSAPLVQNLTSVVSGKLVTLQILDLLPDNPSRDEIVPMVKPAIGGEIIDFNEPLLIKNELAILPTIEATQTFKEQELADEYIVLAEDFTTLLVGGILVPDIYIAESATFAPEAVEAQALPPIVVYIVENLRDAAPEMWHIVAPMLIEITAIVQVLRNFDVGNADPLVIAEATVRLEELCVLLFETTGVDYDPSEVAQFMQLLLPLELMIHDDPNKLREPDLCKEGTREGKRFDGMMARLILAENGVMQSIGMLVLFRIGLGVRA